MGAVSADRELKLNEAFVGRDASRVPPLPELAAHLGELGRLEGEGGGPASVTEGLVGGAVGELVAGGGEPAPGQLIVAADVEAARLLRASGLLAAAPVELAPQDEGPVGFSLERLPTVNEVDVLQRRVRVFRGSVGTATPRRADLDVVVIA